TPPSGDGKATADAAALDESGRLSGPQGDADDLKQIKGVGPAFEKKLNEAGIYHFWQIAALTDAQIATLEEEVGTSGKGAEWKAQSEDLANA
ncbi:MAG: 30S ribosomal protein S1, partial [Hyphomonas sp.]